MQLFDPDDPGTLRPWLIDHVCRFWLARTHDPAGGFFENLDALGSAVANQRRSTLVQARLTYVFSHAYLLSHDPAYREAARHGLAFLMRAARAPDGGWFRTVSVDGTLSCCSRSPGISARPAMSARSSLPMPRGSSCSIGWRTRAMAAFSRSSCRAAPR